jgi:hypothetical protein
MDRGPSYWKLNTSVIHDECTKNDFSLQWGRWRTYKANFPTATLGWELVIKPKIRSFFKRVSAENRKEDHTAEFLYSCIKELIFKGTLTTKEYQQIKICKAQILSIQRRRLEGLKITGKSSQVAENERTTLYNLIAEQKHWATQMIRKIKMADGTVTTVKEDIMKTLSPITKYCSTLQTETKINSTNSWRR